MERWFGGFKCEIGNLAKYSCLAAPHEVIAMRIYYYNDHRIHTALKMTLVAYAASLKQRDEVFAERGVLQSE